MRLARVWMDRLAGSFALLRGSTLKINRVRFHPHREAVPLHRTKAANEVNNDSKSKTVATA